MDLPPETPEQTRAKLQLQEVTAKLLELTSQLPMADQKDIPRLTREIQRYRVAMLTLREIVNDLADPTTYRELTLLNKMLSAADGDGDEGPRQEELDEEAAAQDRLKQAGFNPESASHMIRAFEALRAVSSKFELPMPTLPPAQVPDAGTSLATRRRR